MQLAPCHIGHRTGRKEATTESGISEQCLWFSQTGLELRVDTFCEARTQDRTNQPHAISLF